jgi:hypothetical protein
VIIAVLYGLSALRQLCNPHAAYWIITSLADAGPWCQRWPVPRPGSWVGLRQKEALRRFIRDKDPSPDRCLSLRFAEAFIAQGRY